MAEANPVTDPIGALSALANDPMRDLKNQQKDAYSRSQNQINTLSELSGNFEEADNAEQWGNMAQAAASVPPLVGNFGALLASIGGAYSKTLASQQQAQFNRESAIAKLMGTENAPYVRALTARVGVGGAGGAVTRTLPDGTIVVLNKSDGSEIRRIEPGMSRQYESLYTTYLKSAMENGEYTSLDEARAWAAEQAAKDTGGAPTISRPALAPAAPTLAKTVKGNPEPIGAVPPTYSDDPATEQKVNALATQMDELRAQQRMHKDNPEILADLRSRELALRKEVRALEGSGVPAASAPSVTPTTLAKKDVAAQKGKEKSSEEGAKIYANSFETNVMLPAASFADTGKIMQDFNNLSQMQTALKNGKLKEFMAGDTGKWLLSFAPKDSQLSKGIANAQEADKLTASMVNKILMAAKGIQTEGDADRARSQVTSIGVDPDANKYIEAYISETARQLKMREQSGLAHKQTKGTWEGYDTTWQSSPIMKDAKGSVKKMGSTWVGLTQYMDKFKQKNPSATDSDAVASWNKVK